MKMFKKLAEFLLPAIALGGVVFWYLTAPEYVSDDLLAGMENGDAIAGETIFWAGGCASCHGPTGKKAAAAAENKSAQFVLGGGHGLNTPFGTFYVPNISSDPKHGIGSWTGKQFANAMLKGVSPDGSHYYPAFPYTSYAKMDVKDVANLWAFMKELPAAANSNKSHDIWLPFKLRRGLGLWKMLYLNNDRMVEFENPDEKLARGQYLVESVAHCGECHTPRNIIGGFDKKRWLAGGPSPDGDGNIPNITPHDSGLGNWSLNDIVYSLESGFTPEFDSFGGSMTDVQQNMAKLSASDREAIGIYLKAVLPVASKPK